jgi:hypothetical protein
MTSEEDEMATLMDRKRKNRNVTKLVDLQVDRVDGVRDPATGRKFLLWKSAAARKMDVGLESGRPVKLVRKDGSYATLQKRNGKVVQIDETGDILSGRSRFGVSFANIAFGVTKSQPPTNAVRSAGIKADATSHETRPVDTEAMDIEDARLGSVLGSWAGKVSETLMVDPGRKPYAVDSWLYGNGEGLNQRPVHDYANRSVAPGMNVPTGLNFTPGSNPAGLVAPANFDPPQAGAVRAGDGSIRKSRDRGFWTSVLGSDARPSMEAVAKAMDHSPEHFSLEEHVAMARKLKSREGTPREVPFPLARQRGDAWLAR